MQADAEAGTHACMEKKKKDVAKRASEQASEAIGLIRE